MHKLKSAIFPLWNRGYKAGCYDVAEYFRGFTFFTERNPAE